MSNPVTTPSNGRALWRVFYGVLRKELIILLRYKINTVSQLVGLYVLFAGLLFGGRAIAGGSFQETTTGLVVGFSLWSASSRAFNDVSSKMSREASWGTLEQLYMSPFGFTTTVGATAVAGVVESLVHTSVLFVVTALTAGVSLQFDLLGAIVAAVFGIVSLLGVGLFFGGLAIRYKRVSNVLSLLLLVHPVLIAAPAGQFPVLKFLPLVESSFLLRRMFGDGVSLLSFPATDLALLVGTAVGYLTIGLAGLVFFVNRARENGVMGHY